MAQYALFCLIMSPLKGEVPVFARLWPVGIRDGRVRTNNPWWLLRNNCPSRANATYRRPRTTFGQRRSSWTRRRRTPTLDEFTVQGLPKQVCDAPMNCLVNVWGKVQGIWCLYAGGSNHAAGHSR